MISDLRPQARVARGATFLFAQGFFNAAMGLLYFIMLAHTFSDPSEQWQMGAIALLSFILSLVQVIGTFALPYAAVKYISQHLAEGDSKKARAVVARVLQVSLLASSVAFMALFIPAEWLSSQMFGTTAYALLLRIIALCCTFTILNAGVGGFLQGMQKMRDFALISSAYTVSSALVGVYLLLFGWRLYAVALGWLAGLLVSFAAGIILIIKHLGVLERPYPVRPLVKFSFPLYVADSVGFFVGWIDQLFLVSYMSLLPGGAVEAQRILGIYYVAVRASLVPSLFSNSIIAALFPQLSELYTQRGASSMEDAFHVSTRYSVLIGFPLIIGLATLARPIIILFAGWYYVEAAEPLIIISIAALVWAIGAATRPILMTLERTALWSALSTFTVVLSALLSYITLAYLGLGMIGTAWARSLATIIGTALSLYALRRYIPLSFDKEALWKASVASAFMALAIVALDVVRNFVSPDSYEFLVIRLHLLPIYIIVGASAYFLTLIALKAIKRRDVELVEEYLPKKLKRVAAWLKHIAVAD